jgi:hypothetical protein
LSEIKGASARAAIVAPMIGEPDELRARLERYRYLHRMIEDPAVRTVLDDEIAALERRLAGLDGASHADDEPGDPG